MSQMTTPEDAADAAAQRDLHDVIDQRVITILEAYDTVKIRDGLVERDSLIAELRRLDGRDA